MMISIIDFTDARDDSGINNRGPETCVKSYRTITSTASICSGIAARSSAHYHDENVWYYAFVLPANVGLMYRAIDPDGRYFNRCQYGIIMPRAPTQVDTDDLDDATEDAWGQDVEEAQVEHYS
jgi:hypothetical protein